MSSVNQHFDRPQTAYPKLQQNKFLGSPIWPDPKIVHVDSKNKGGFAIIHVVNVGPQMAPKAFLLL